jgi:kynurenine formamidase
LVIVENLTNLAAVPDRPFTFIGFPLKIKDADGSPVRAVAMVP